MTVCSDYSIAATPFRFSTLVDLLQYRSLHQANQIAYTFLVDGETEAVHLTYRELDQQARAIAAQLISLGMTGERALMLYPSGLEFISAFFGCLYAGVIAVPAYPPRANQNLLRVQAIVDDAQAAIALTPSTLLANLERRWAEGSNQSKLRWLATDSITIDAANQWQTPGIQQDTLAFFQYTSGSTGAPKGVMVSHGNLLHNELMIANAFGHSDQSIVVGWLPLFHDMGLVGNMLQPLYLGRPCIFMSPVSFLQKPMRWLQAISTYQATTSGGPNFAYDLCVQRTTPEQRSTLDLSRWNLAFTGAEPIRAETLERFAEAFAPCGFRKEAFYPCYGMAETTLFVTGGLKTKLPVIQTIDAIALAQNQIVSALEDQPATRKIVGCGHAWLNQKVAIVNPETLMECSDHQVGEIWVSGESIAQGYWNQPEITEKTFRAYLADTGEGPFLRTGDLGFVQNNELFFTGRLKDIIIIRGRNHYPQDIELTVEQSHTALRSNSSAAFSIDVHGEERLVVLAEIDRRHRERRKTKEQANPVEAVDLSSENQQVIATMRQAIAEDHELNVYAIVLLKPGSIPKTSSGKIQRHACRACYLTKSLETVAEWTEATLSSSSGGVTAIASPAGDEPTGTSEFSQPTIQAWLRSRLADYLKIQPDEIEVQEPLARYGLDSSVAVSITGELADWLSCKLEPTLFWEYPTVEQIAEYLEQEALLVQRSTGA